MCSRVETIQTEPGAGRAGPILLLLQLGCKLVQQLATGVHAKKCSKSATVLSSTHNNTDVKKCSHTYHWWKKETTEHKTTQFLPIRLMAFARNWKPCANSDALLANTYRSMQFLRENRGVCYTNKKARLKCLLVALDWSMYSALSEIVTATGHQTVRAGISDVGVVA